MVNYERAKLAIGTLATEAERHLDLNEATTRLRLIDRLLFDTLDWAPEDITTEQYESGDYLDYVLGRPERLAVIEAKRTGRHFELPVGVEKERYVDVKTIYDYNHSNKAALEQVVRYCQTGGISLAVLCNGHQLIAFLGSRGDGTPPLSGRALVFASLVDMERDFSLFWDCLSREGVAAGTLRLQFARRGQLAPPPERLSARIGNYPGFRYRSELETDVRILADLFLQDLVQEDEVSDEFLEECYCTSGALSQYALVSKEILRSRYAEVHKVAAVDNVAKGKKKEARLTGDLLSAALTRRPLVLLGDVGVGKTIFLKHFIRIEAADVLKKSIVFYVDLLRQSSLLDDVRQYLVDSMISSLEAQAEVDIFEGPFVRAVYNKEVNQFKKSLYGGLRETNPSEYARFELDMLSKLQADGLGHLRRSLEHLRGSRGTEFVLVLDNIDHHELEFQERLFVIGQSLSETWPLAVFMSLRPDTFYTSKKRGSLTAYQPRVFTVEPPRTDLVILKRLDFARTQLHRTGRLDSFPTGLTIDSDNLLVYLNVLVEAFKNNNQLKELVDNLSSGNVRQALDFVSRFVGSGYVSTARILEVHDRGGLYTLPIHEFIRSILYGEYSHYDPRSSAVCNILDITSSDGREHFTLPIILAACQARGESSQNGYVDERNVYEHLQGLGYAVGQIEAQIQRGVDWKLLDVSRDDPGMRSVRVTAAGGYMHQRMLTFFAYIDGMIVDTPIVDPAVRRDVGDVQSINDRLDRADIFRRYLDSQWKFDEAATTFSWPDVSAKLARDMERTSTKASRASRARR
ncbi:hypothetical protein [Amycolatopsis antarctica]|uniref:hypothetical protein n=1 Tax=Amycolatopsis antarctica TaxID=1854586 RepID=UPI00105551E5|nr:hypothetical protein [Amycolatopsis antarctica]